MTFTDSWGTEVGPLQAKSAKIDCCGPGDGPQMAVAGVGVSSVVLQVGGRTSKMAENDVGRPIKWMINDAGGSGTAGMRGATSLAGSPPRPALPGVPCRLC